MGIINIDGKLYWEDTKVLLTEDELKTFFNDIRVNAINAKIESIILPKYSVIKQINISAKRKKSDTEYYTDTDIEEMNIFIDTVRAIGRNAKDNGIELDKIDWAGLDQ